MEEKEITKEKAARSDKRQTEILIGMSFLIIAVIITVIALYQPRVISSKESSAEANESNYYSTASMDTSAAETKSESETTVNDANLMINLNTCTAEDLMKLKGIGESKANAIIAYRNVIGSYSDTAQIKNISGISDKIYESIKDYITV